MKMTQPLLNPSQTLMVVICASLVNSVDLELEVQVYP
jgi:hypothetical protein